MESHRPTTSVNMTAGTSQIRTSTGETINVDINIDIDNLKTVRVINLPVEVKNENILHALQYYGEILSLTDEMWAANYQLKVKTGVCVLKIKLNKDIPSILTVEGHTGFAVYYGQHMCAECPTLLWGAAPATRNWAQTLAAGQHTVTSADKTDPTDTRPPGKSNSSVHNSSVQTPIQDGTVNGSEKLVSLPIHTSPGTSIVSQKSLMENAPNGRDHFVARPLHLIDGDDTLEDDDMTGVTTHTHILTNKVLKRKEEAQKRLTTSVRKRSPAINAATHDKMSSFLKAHNRNPTNTALQELVTAIQVEDVVDILNIQRPPLHVSCAFINYGVIPAAFTDHSFLLCTIDCPPRTPVRGRNYWRLQARLVGQDEVDPDFRQRWLYWVRQKPRYADAADWWERCVEPGVRWLLQFHGARCRHEQASVIHFYERALRDLDTTASTEANVRDTARRLKEKILHIHRNNMEQRMQFFHTCTTLQQERLSIQALASEQKMCAKRHVDAIRTLAGTTLRDPVSIAAAFLDHYSRLYSEQTIDNCEITDEEVALIAQHTPKKKSPGIDGIPYEFYQHYCPVIQAEFCNMLRTVINRNALCRFQTEVSLLNIDLDKAFDRVNWNLLDRIMLHVGFPPPTIAILQTLRRGATTQISLNGRLGESFTIKSSVRQGCPLSMSQFVLYIKPLLRTLHSKLNGISVWTRTLTYFGYADDVTCVVRSEDDVARINDTLSAFTRAATAQVNSAKTKLLDLKPEPHALRHVTPYVKTDKLRTLGIEFMQNSEQMIKCNWDSVVHKVLRQPSNCSSSAPIPHAKSNRGTNTAVGWFMWRGYLFRANREQLLLPADREGLGLVNMKLKARGIVNVVPRVQLEWANLHRDTIWKNIADGELPIALRASAYSFINDLTPTKIRRKRIFLDADDRCVLCDHRDTALHRITSCIYSRPLRTWCRRRIARRLNVAADDIREETLCFLDLTAFPTVKRRAVVWLLMNLIDFTSIRRHTSTYLNLLTDCVGRGG
ncbi:hypothetical protein PR048_000776 [Dryococelus australis]|uniref:Reverse transcriptase domain-containing protein n=1 Tax=Dryococelus australis TaxID=614101 RepID=A0ABQ9IFI9_9NEOP|nr:hypothetical protein PR048_000776 [Dryococelus australis]